MFGTTQSREVVSKLNKAGFEAVFVGGAVRDYLLGKKPKDIDIATAAMPEQVKTVFSTTVDLGTEHGTVLVIEDGEPIEVTTYRTEDTYSDNRRPDQVHFVTSLTEDLRRRDFTINALAMMSDGEIVDPFGGRKDLKNQTIRAVGDAHERFSEDALRIVRAIRFVSVLGFKLDVQTKESVIELAPSVRSLSVERIKAELDKLFQGAYSAEALKLIKETHLSDTLPIYPKRSCLLERCAPFRNALDGWAALMTSGGFSAAEISRAYKLSNRERLFLHSVQSFCSIRQQRMFTRRDYYGADVNAILTAEKISAILNNREPIEEKQIRTAINTLPIQTKKDLAVGGHHLLAWKQARPGRWLGKALDAIEEAVLQEVLPNDENVIKEWFLHEYKCEE